MSPEKHFAVVDQPLDDGRRHAEPLVGRSFGSVRVHRLRSRLHDVQLSAVAVLRPLDIDRAAVVLFDGERHARQFEGLLA